MDWIGEIRERRVPQFTISYLVGGFGLIQFLDFLEGRMQFSPHVVNLVGLGLLLLLPSILVLAWSLGRPGRDTLGGAQKVAIPANLLAAAVLLFAVFQGKELGAVTQTIEVQDEHGTITERVIPKNEFRKRLLGFYLESSLTEDDPWIRETVPTLLTSDLSQDLFLDVALPLSMPNAFRDAGYPDGHGVPRPLMRKMAVDNHFSQFCTGSVEREGQEWVVQLELHDAEKGRVMAERTYRNTDLFDLIDEASLQMRKDLGLPAAHLEDGIDVPVVEMASADLDAVRQHVAGAVMATHHNDWAGALPHLEESVRLDPQYAMAQFLLFATYQTLGQEDKSAEAMDMAMQNLYRVNERASYMIKSQYYYNIEKDMDKALAVLEMWTQLWPNDVAAYQQLALFRFVRQDLDGAIAAYEKILEIDPSAYNYLDNIASLQKQLKRYDQAEATLMRYVERFPARPDGYSDLADFYMDIGRFDDARAQLDEALLHDPGDLVLKGQIIKVDVKVGNFAAAEDALSAMMARELPVRRRALCHVLALDLARNRGQADAVATELDSLYACLAQFQQPLQLDIGYAMLVPALTMAGRPEAALARLDEIAARIPEGFRDLTGTGRAWALADLGRLDEARTQLEAARVMVDAYNFETFRTFLAQVGGVIAMGEGDTEGAARLFREALDRKIQEEPNLYPQLAEALRVGGDLKEASEVVEEGMKLFPAHARTRLEAARIALAQGKNDQAAAHLDKALEAWSVAAEDFEPAREARRLMEGLSS